MGAEKYQNDRDSLTSDPGFGVIVRPAALNPAASLALREVLP
jgi:hypothetical protein